MLMTKRFGASTGVALRQLLMRSVRSSTSSAKANKPTAKGTDFTQHFWDETEKFTFSYPIQAQVEG